ncbi:hypothetical protein ScalyP_jg5235 [Parmales sp. scaly parma]|nr:hypothetical protein ScalyP_jg5235 [Parmales sp. scaly parma]
MASFKSDTRDVKIALIGMTGTGKSTFINAMGHLGKDKSHYPSGSKRPPPLISSAGADSCTRETSSLDAEFDDGRPVKFIDTPGLGDSGPGDNGESQDTINVRNMITHLKKEEYVNCFAIVFNGQSPKLDAGTKGMISLFSQCFGPDFLGNAVIVFSRWSQNEELRDDRNDAVIEAGYPSAEQMKTEQFDAKFAQEFNYTGRPIPKLFIDSNCGIKGKAGPGLEHFLMCTSQFTTTAYALSEFKVDKSKAEKTKLDKMKDYEKELLDANKKKEKEFKKQREKWEADAKKARKQHKDEMGELNDKMSKMDLENKQKLAKLEEDKEAQEKRYAALRVEMRESKARAIQLEKDMKDEKDKAERARLEAERDREAARAEQLRAQNALNAAKAAAAQNVGGGGGGYYGGMDYQQNLPQMPQYQNHRQQPRGGNDGGEQLAWGPFRTQYFEEHGSTSRGEQSSAYAAHKAQYS